MEHAWTAHYQVAYLVTTMPQPVQHVGPAFSTSTIIHQTVFSTIEVPDKFKPIYPKISHAGQAVITVTIRIHPSVTDAMKDTMCITSTTVRNVCQAVCNVWMVLVVLQHLVAMLLEIILLLNVPRTADSVILTIFHSVWIVGMGISWPVQLVWLIIGLNALFLMIINLRRV